MTDDACDAALRRVLDWLWAARPLEEAALEEPALEAGARALLLDTVGCAIAGMAEPAVQALFAAAADGDAGPIRFPGSAHGLSAAGFCLAFGAAACWHEACEGLAVAHGRPGLHAIPAVLGPALVQGATRAVTLGAVLDAVIAGYEVGGRMGIACRIRPGMHVDGTWGSFGAAAASCRLRGASAAVAQAALDHVACHMPFSLYRPITEGSTARNAYVGHGAAHGAASATAAMAGLGGPPGSIAAMARLALGLEALPAFPGAGTWLLAEGYLKPYPAVRHVHYGAAAAEAWHGDGGGDAAAITGVELDVYAEALTYCGNRAPRTPIQAQFSLSYGVARSLVHGRLDPSGYTEAALADPAVRRLEAMIVLRPDPVRTEAGLRGATLTVRTAAGLWRRAVDALPAMGPAEVRAKFRAYADPVIGADHAAAIAARLLDGPLDAPLRLDAGA